MSTEVPTGGEPGGWRRPALRTLLVLVLLPAVGLTVLRLLQLDLGPAVRLVSFTPFAVPFYLLGVVAAVALLVRRRAVLDVVGGALAVGGLVMHVAWLAPLWVADAPAPTSAERVGVLTVNASFGEGDPEAVMATVRESEVELLAVSEITPTFLAGLERAGVDEVLPERAGETAPAVEGTMVFSRERIEVLAELDTEFRGYVVRTGGLTYVATHPRPPLYPDAWRRELGVVLDAARDNDADVVLGDLNATLDHGPVQDLVDAGWRDAVELTGGGFDPTWPSHGEFAPFPGPVVAIDHVLVREPWTVVEATSVDIPDTDHRAVLATLAPAG